MPALLIFSGLPGAGKSTLAQAFVARVQMPLLRMDVLQGVIPYPAAGPGADYWAMLYAVLFTLAETQLALGLSVALDSVFHGPERQTARELAERCGAEFRAVYVYCSDEMLWRARVERRRESLPDAATWSNVQSSRTFFAAWQPTEALFVDTVAPLETNLAQLREWLGYNWDGM